jgi:hypothetical protein
VSPRDALTYAVGGLGLVLLGITLAAWVGFLWVLWGIYELLG